MESPVFWKLLIPNSDLKVLLNLIDHTGYRLPTTKQLFMPANSALNTSNCLSDPRTIACDAVVLPERFHSLDALRGIAALVVVLYHWKFFFYDGTVAGQIAFERQPFYPALQSLYLGGWRAVDLFFCLSGFIFFWLYSQPIINGTVSLKTFGILRFSRLYPLHLVTLIIVCLGQAAMRRYHGTDFATPNNDFFHFCLHLLFASSWGFVRSGSFNGPVWSVSVEILLYAMFFAACRFRLCRWPYLTCVVVLGYLISLTASTYIGRGVSAFFIGCLTFKLMFRWRNWITSNTSVYSLFALTATMWIWIPFDATNNVLYSAYRSTFSHGGFNIFGKDLGGFILLNFAQMSFVLLLFPLTILTLATLEIRRRGMGKPLAFLGDISYSSYLLHFPLQLMIVLVIDTIGISHALFTSTAALILFFLLLLLLSLFSYHCFERPAQKFLRCRLM